VHPDDAATMITSTSDTHVASATTNHKVHHMVHGPLNPEKALKTGGLCFAPVYSEIDNADRRGGKRLPFALMSVGLQALTGIITGVAAYGVGFVSEAIGKLRLDATVQLAQDGNWGSGLVCLIQYHGVFGTCWRVACHFVCENCGVFWHTSNHWYPKRM